ncbi:MAG: hypothetical protein EZS28_000903 [Streblomastix strix]|uniref:Uncharacterized protein n=1 Tax=Streblomastix strix TaxID=222440 RepID=A0A5J4X8R1_9EUKA|nr:MAG: hypothetical protein EZS28_000903 [Streblomastix strix]
MKTLIFRRPFPNPLQCSPLDLSLMYLNAQLLSILLVRAVPGESSSLPFIQTGSRAQFYCYYISVGGLIVELGAGGVNKLDYCVYYTPNVGELYMNYGKPSVMLCCLYNKILQPKEGWACWKRPGYGKP